MLPAGDQTSQDNCCGLIDAGPWPKQDSGEGHKDADALNVV